jgi:hypothetical protein
VLWLRSRTAQFRIDVTWPPDAVRPGGRGYAATVLAGSPGGLTAAVGGAIADAGVVVLAVHSGAEAHEGLAETLGWLGDHAADLGVDPSRLALTQVGVPAAAAVGAAEHARGGGWPPLARLLVVLPPPEYPTHADAVPPAVHSIGSVTAVLAPGAEPPPILATLAPVTPVRIRRVGVTGRRDLDSAAAAAAATDLADLPSHPLASASRPER